MSAPAGLREMAARARRLAQDMLDEQNLTAFAAELEARAAALETISHDEAAAVQRSDPDLGQS